MLTWETKWLRGASATPNLSGCDEVREPRRRNSPSDPTSREIEDYALTGHASVRSWCAACVQGRGRAERDQGEGRKELEDGSKVPVVSWDCCFFGARNRISEAEVGQGGDSPVLVILHGVTKSMFCSFDSRKRSRLHHVRSGKIRVSKMSELDNPSDAQTKYLGPEPLLRHTKACNWVPVVDDGKSL